MTSRSLKNSGTPAAGRAFRSVAAAEKRRQATRLQSLTQKQNKSHLTVGAGSQILITLTVWLPFWPDKIKRENTDLESTAKLLNDAG